MSRFSIISRLTVALASWGRSGAAARARISARGELPVAMSVAAEETRDELNEIVERAADPARAEGVTVATHTLIGSAAQALCDLAESVGADLLVVGNRGMKGGRRFLGSVPNTISHHAPCSVLIYETTHPHEQPADA